MNNKTQLIESIYQFLLEKGLNRTSEDEDLYDKERMCKDYYSSFSEGLKFTDVPLCWKERDNWYLLSGFFIKDSKLYAEIYDLQTGPPDFGWCEAENVAVEVLQEALGLLIKQY